jgi:hypothetical protein
LALSRHDAGHLFELPKAEACILERLFYKQADFLFPIIPAAGWRQSPRCDRFRCRACGASARLVVHHRSGDNQKRRLITLCVGCHTRVHRYRALWSWVPEVLLKLWRERHPGQPVQLQLLFGVNRQVNHRSQPSAQDT